MRVQQTGAASKARPLPEAPPRFGDPKSASSETFGLARFEPGSLEVPPAGLRPGGRRGAVSIPSFCCALAYKKKVLTPSAPTRSGGRGSGAWFPSRACRAPWSRRTRITGFQTGSG